MPSSFLLSSQPLVPACLPSLLLHSQPWMSEHAPCRPSLPPPALIPWAPLACSPAALACSTAPVSDPLRPWPAPLPLCLPLLLLQMPLPNRDAKLTLELWARPGPGSQGDVSRGKQERLLGYNIVLIPRRWVRVTSGESCCAPLLSR